MGKVVVYVEDLNQYMEIRNWLSENVGNGNWREWIPIMRIEGVDNPEHNRRTFSFDRPEDETHFRLKWQ